MILFLWLFFCRASLYFHRIAISNFHTSITLALPSTPWKRHHLLLCHSWISGTHPPDDFQHLDALGRPFWNNNLPDETKNRYYPQAEKNHVLGYLGNHFHKVFELA